MKTEIIKIENEYDKKPIKQVSRLLDEGALVAFPTETVYGIGCRVEPTAIERLNRIKDRQPGKRYTLHVGTVEQIARYVPRLSLRAQKLLSNALPGPITVVFELDDVALKVIQKKMESEVFELLYQDFTLGVRCPDHPVASAILSEAKYPIVAPSANPAGKDPATTVDQVAAYFHGILDAIVDSQPIKTYQKSSSVVKIGKAGIQVLRDGAVPAEQIRQLSTVRILFVCTGNTCRSPMAEAIAKKHFCNILSCSVDELPNFGYIVKSAGVAAMPGIPASEHAVQVCQQQGISLQEHQSVSLIPQQIDESDRIFVMSQGHRQSIIEFYPEAAEKCFLLDENGDIADPIGRGKQTYQRCFEQIEKSIRQRASEIL